MSDEASTALHEAAHALVAHVLGFKHEGISIVPNKDSFGRYTPFQPADKVYEVWEDNLVLNLAPALLELDRGEDSQDVLRGAKNDIASCVLTFNHFTNDQHSVDDADSLKEITHALRQAPYIPDGSGSKRFQVFHRAAHKAFNIISEHRVIMHKLQVELQRCKEMTGVELTSFFEDACLPVHSCSQH